MKPSHYPNKLEIIISGLIIFFSAIMSGIILPIIISTDKLPLFAIIGFFLLLSILFVLGIQSLFNVFYSKWTKYKS